MIRSLVICLMISGVQQILHAQAAPRSGSLFDPELRQVVRIEIRIRKEHLDVLRRQPRTDVPTEVVMGSIPVGEAQVHIKGRKGSLRAIDDKPSLTLDFDPKGLGRSVLGQTKIHLNNSVEDPSFLSESLAAAVLQHTGLAAPRVAYADVVLNGRELGVFVLKESFQDLLREWESPMPALFEPTAGGDLERPPELKKGTPPPDDRSLPTLVTAARLPDPAARGDAMAALLELDAVLRFLAFEVMMGHRDGYAIAVNNYRLAFRHSTGRWQFLPSGMDQLLGNPRFPVEPEMAGLVARSIMEIPGLRTRYRAILGRMVEQDLVVDRLLAGLRVQRELLRGYFGRRLPSGWKQSCDDLESRLRARQVFLREEMAKPEPAAIRFVAGVASLTNWVVNNPPLAGRMRRGEAPDGRSALWIRAEGQASSSWRARVLLDPGRYRFLGSLRVSAVEGMSFAKHNGARLRVVGTGLAQPVGRVGTHPWTEQTVEFRVTTRREMELVCELRARSGEAWFEIDSLRLIRLELDSE